MPPNILPPSLTAGMQRNDAENPGKYFGAKFCFSYGRILSNSNGPCVLLLSNICYEGKLQNMGRLEKSFLEDLNSLWPEWVELRAGLANCCLCPDYLHNSLSLVTNFRQKKTQNVTQSKLSFAAPSKRRHFYQFLARWRIFYELSVVAGQPRGPGSNKICSPR